MRVLQVITSDNKTRYMLVNSYGEMVIPVMKFIKYKDNTGTARNTLRSYCYALKLYFEFLEQKEISYTNVGIDELADLYRRYILEVHTNDVDTDFIFIKLTGNREGKPLDYQSVQALFKRLEAKTGIKVTPHMLRHTNITELWKTGEMRPESIQKRAGHAHIQTTMQMYVHPTEEDIRADWEKAMKKKDEHRGGSQR